MCALHILFETWERGESFISKKGVMRIVAKKVTPHTLLTAKYRSK
jgi:hypothetical protein